jgi:flagellar basal-body rod protein FlgC
MDLIGTMNISAGGLMAQRTRLNVISMNLANANTTKTENGGPYRQKTAIFRTVPATKGFEDYYADALDRKLQGVQVKSIDPVDGPFKKIFDPSHPDADEKGFVYLPNVNVVQEMVKMLNANRSYEANAAAVKAAKEMALKALDIGR